MTAIALRHFSVCAVLCAGSICFTAVLAVCSTMSQAWAPGAIFLLMLVGGLGRSLGFATMGALAFADVPKPRLAAATSFQGTAQQLMKAVGMTVAAGTIQACMIFCGSAHTERWQLACGFIVTALVVLASLPMFARGCPKRALAFRYRQRSARNEPECGCKSCRCVKIPSYLRQIHDPKGKFYM